jgi:hypothetical protein
MANSMFATPEQFMNHVVTALPASKTRAAELFEGFQQYGYIARQEDVGISVVPKGLGINLYAVLAEGAKGVYGFVPVVMLSHPSMSDDEFDSWVDVVQAWSAGLPAATMTAYSREIKIQKKVEDGIPATYLNKSLPPSLLLSYRRPGDFVIVIDPAPGGRRSIFTTKNIG